jgi:hypothetical protein
MKLTKTFLDELIFSPTVVHADLIKVPHIFTVGEKKTSNHNIYHKTRKYGRRNGNIC